MAFRARRGRQVPASPRRACGHRRSRVRIHADPGRTVNTCHGRHTTDRAERGAWQRRNSRPCGLAHLAARSICLINYGKTPCDAARATARRPAPHRLAASLHCGCTLRRVRCFQLQSPRSHLERFRIIGHARYPRLPLGRKFFVLFRVHGGWVNFTAIPALPVFNVSKICSPR